MRTESNRAQDRKLQSKTNVLLLQKAKCNKSSDSPCSCQKAHVTAPYEQAQWVCVCFCRMYLTGWIAICICLYKQFGCFNESMIWWVKEIIKSHIFISFLTLAYLYPILFSIHYLQCFNPYFTFLNFILIFYPSCLFFSLSSALFYFSSDANLIWIFFMPIWSFSVERGVLPEISLWWALSI